MLSIEFCLSFHQYSFFNKLESVIYIIILYCLTKIQPRLYFHIHLYNRFMSAANFTLISDLDVLKDIFTMKLRVIRLWTLKCYWNTDELFSIEIIFMDEQVYYMLIVLNYLCSIFFFFLKTVSVAPFFNYFINYHLNLG